VEDSFAPNALTRRLARTDRGLEVVGTATSVADTEAIIRGTRPQLAVVDLLLGGEGGLWVAAQIGKRWPDLPWAALAASFYPRLVWHAFSLGARGFLFRKDALDEIVEALQVVAAGGVGLTPRVTPVAAALELVEGQHPLTRREKEIVLAVAKGEPSRVIAAYLKIRVQTVRRLKQQALEKLGIDTTIRSRRAGRFDGFSVNDLT
jgi:DNA-binding NarL/FixJ family response regulator